MDEVPVSSVVGLFLQSPSTSSCSWVMLAGPWYQAVVPLQEASIPDGVMVQDSQQKHHTPLVSSAYVL